MLPQMCQFNGRLGRDVRRRGSRRLVQMVRGFSKTAREKVMPSEAQMDLVGRVGQAPQRTKISLFGLTVALQFPEIVGDGIDRPHGQRGGVFLP